MPTPPENPDDHSEITPGGSRVYRHTRRTVPERFVHGDSEYIGAVSDHIEKHIGQIHMVWHEIVSELVHVDVYHVAPDDGRPFHTLITSGMGEAPMNAPDVEQPLHSELLTVLPRSWKLSQDDFKDEANYWPVRFLKYCARLPHEYDTWIGPGHTIPTGDPPTPVVPGSPFHCVMMMLPYAFSPNAAIMDYMGRKVSFLQMIPLTLAEMEYKLQHGSDELGKRFEALNLDFASLYRPDRRCAVTKPRSWWKLW